MPVFTRFQDSILVLTVDGDFTANEVRRVAFGALESTKGPQRIPVLLDMSGAAGIAGKTPDEMRAMGSIFGVYRDRIRGLGVVVSAEVEDQFRDDGDLAREAGVDMYVCHSHADARAWLGRQDT